MPPPRSTGPLCLPRQEVTDERSRPVTPGNMSGSPDRTQHDLARSQQTTELSLQLRPARPQPKLLSLPHLPCWSLGPQRCQAFTSRTASPEGGYSTAKDITTAEDQTGLSRRALSTCGTSSGTVSEGQGGAVPREALHGPKN